MEKGITSAKAFFDELGYPPAEQIIGAARIKITKSVILLFFICLPQLLSVLNFSSLAFQGMLQP